MISYTYDRCLKDMTMIESVITTGKPLFTQWTVLRKDGRDQGTDNIPLSRHISL